MPQEDQDHEADDQHLEEQLVGQGVDRALDQLRAVVGGHDAHALGEGRLDLLEAFLDPADHLARVLAVAHDHDAADHVAPAVQVGDPAPDLRAQGHRGHVAQEHGGALLVGLEDDVLEVLARLQVAAAAHHVLAARELEEPAPDLVVAVADRARHVHDREVVGLQPVGVDRDLVLLDEAPERRHLGDAGHGLDAIAEVPVLERAEVGRAQGVAVVHEGVLEDPAHAGGVGPELRLHPGGQQRLDLGEVLEDAAPRPVDVGPVLEDHVDVAEAEVGEAADDLHVRRAEEAAHDRVGHLVFHDVRAPVPARVDDDLGVGEVGDGVDRDVADGVDAVGDRHRGGEQDEDAVSGAEADDGLDHRGLSAGEPLWETPESRPAPGTRARP